MAVRESARQDVRFAENVALLSLINPVPLRDYPSPPLCSSQDHDPARLLSSPEVEGYLANGLAFLAGISDSSEHVVALCLEELPDSLKVVIAINKGRPRDGQEILDMIRNGIPDVFNVLAKVEQDTSRKLFRDLVQAVVRLCRVRILQRICSKRLEPRWQSMKTSKAYLGQTLERVTDIVAHPRNLKRLRKEPRQEAEAFVETSRTLATILDDLENCPEDEVNRVLGKATRTASRLGKVAKLPVLIQDVPSNFQPNEHQGLTRRLAKLARYHEFSCYLYRVAKKQLGLFRAVRIETVSLDKRYFDTPRPGATLSSLSACVTRSCSGDATLTRLCQKAGVQTTKATERFNTTARITLSTTAKIHAEVQILAHYDLNPSHLPPRIIASNKDACYLCYQLISLHGKYRIRGTHGKLWPSWKLPALAAYDNLHGMLNRELQGQIRHQSERLLLRKKSQVVPPANESTVFPLSPSLESFGSESSSPLTSVDGISDGIGPGKLETGEPVVRVAHSTGKAAQNIGQDSAHLPRSEEGSESVASALVEGNITSNQHGKLPCTAGTVGPGTPQRTISAESSSSSSTAASAEDLEICAVLEGRDGARPYTQGGGHENMTVTPGSVQEHGATRQDEDIQLVDGVAMTKKGGHDSARITGKQKGYDMDLGGPLRPADVQRPPTNSPVTLTKGTTVKCRLDNSQQTPSCTAGLLTLTPEFVRVKEGAKTTGTCELHLEWLTDEDASMARRTGQRITDVQTLEDGVDFDSGSPDCVIVEEGQVTVRIDIVRS